MGGAALLCQPGDLLIIIAYEERDRAEVMREGHQAKVLVTDENNRPQDFIEQNLIPQGSGVKLHSASYSHSRLCTVIWQLNFVRNTQFATIRRSLSDSR